MEISVNTPRNFSFKRTVISHGWCELLPFQIDREKWVLTRTLDLKESKPVTLTITANRRALLINPSRRLSQADIKKVIRDVRHMLRLDDDIGAFYRLLAADDDFNWIPSQGAGRLLRSPTVFEDLVKMICTTNCSWALTEKMVTGLVETLGRTSGNGHRTFPSPEAMALMPVKFYVNEVRAGYRAEYLKELADRVASGALDVEAWLASPLATADLTKEMRGVKGVGPYAAENLLKLLGRYDGLALDSWTRAKFFSVRNNGRKTTDKKIARYYSRFKEWRGLALWCDMTRDWLDGQEPAAESETVVRS
jgi:3-methyladenine DNA glycosylase/8-oxoguanine DNA glycosylase